MKLLIVRSHWRSTRSAYPYATAHLLEHWDG